MKIARARALTGLGTAGLLLAVTGCSTMGGDSASEPSSPSSPAGDGEVGGTVVLVTKVVNDKGQEILGAGLPITGTPAPAR
jgi:hypothetical protein